MKTKRRLAVLSLSILSAGLVSACSLIALSTEKKKDENNGSLNISEVENFRILSSTKSTDGNTISVNYSLMPATINYVNFNASLKWSDKESAEFESATWHENKDCDEYIKYEINQPSKTIIFTCLQPFGHEILFTMSSPNNSAIRSSMTLNYSRKEITAPTVNIDANGFVENQALHIDCTLPVYSVGSVGEKPTDKFNIEKTYINNGDKRFDDLFVQPSTTGLYASSFKFNGKAYSNPELLRMDIRDHVNEYMLSLIELKNPKTFTAKEFEEAFTYEYAAYSMAGKTVFLKNSTLMTSFLQKYQTYYESGSAYQVTVNYDKRKIFAKKLSIELSQDSLTDIRLEDTDIVF